MDRKSVLEELVAAAHSLGIKVRTERLGTGTHLSGGLVRLKGHWVLFVDSRGSIPDRLATLTRALSRFDTSPLALSDEATRLVGAASESNASPLVDVEPAMALKNKSPFLRPKPGLRRTEPSDSTPYRPAGYDAFAHDSPEPAGATRSPPPAPDDD